MRLCVLSNPGGQVCILKLAPMRQVPDHFNIQKVLEVILEDSLAKDSTRFSHIKANPSGFDTGGDGVRKEVGRDNDARVVGDAQGASPAVLVL